MSAIEEAIDVALDWEMVEIGIQGGRAGRVKVFMDEEGIGIGPIANVEVEVLDMFLEQIDTVNPEQNEIGPSVLSR
ncbi:hypothetical protein ACFFS2_32620 [Streptomyces aurantiacus]|nr:hypothetical protein [Streptomyces aurantiacus]